MHATTGFSNREERLQNFYNKAFIGGAEDGTFLRAIVSK
jgi:hypothetical protein